MRLYLNDFSLLRGRHFCIMTGNGLDSILISNDEFDIIDLFFTLIDYGFITANLGLQSNDLKRQFYLGIDNSVYFGDHMLAANAYHWELREFMLLGGYLYILLSIHLVTYASLVVAEWPSFRFVGCISQKFNNISTGELSRLILTHPEIDWSGV